MPCENDALGLAGGRGRRHTERTMSAGALPSDTVHGAGAATRLIVAASVGNALEFYEILVYGYFAVS